jgi:hypothetical protein
MYCLIHFAYILTSRPAQVTVAARRRARANRADHCGAGGAGEIKARLFRADV